MHQQLTAFENIVGKEEIARNEQFLLFPQCFLLNQRLVCPFVNIYDIISLFGAELEEPKIGKSGKGLKGHLSCTCISLFQGEKKSGQQEALGMNFMNPFPNKFCFFTCLQ